LNSSSSSIVRGGKVKVVTPPIYHLGLQLIQITRETPNRAPEYKSKAKHQDSSADQVV